MTGDLPPGFELWPAGVNVENINEFSRYHSCANTLDIMRAKLKASLMDNPDDPKVAKQLEIIVMAEGLVVNERNKYLKEINHE
jgi:hypothetical protein